MEYDTNDASAANAQARFDALRGELITQFKHYFPDDMALKTVIIVPSQSLDPEILAKVKGIIHYEERLLCLLLLLRMPRTRIIYLSSMPIDDTIIDYYLHLLPGVTVRHARQRLTLLSCHDTSNRPLTQKILDRPRLIEKIRNSILPGHAAHMSGFNITYLEHELALQLGVPLYGCPAYLAYWGTKTGSREIFRRAGLPMPPGYEHLENMAEVLEALRELKKEYPSLSKAVVKLNDGFSGEGNAIFSYEAAGADLNEDVLRQHLKMVANDLTYDVFAEKIALMGGIVEAFIGGEEKSSPSVQCRINPLKQIEVLSSHDQLLDAETGQIYLGCTFPANRAYSHEIGKMGYQVAEELSRLGAIGRFGVDFISVKQDNRWQHYAIEINLRKGGTTHPYIMLQFLTDGYYDHHTGIYHTPSGRNLHYLATDCLQSESYKTLTPEDLMDIAICNHIHYNATKQEGVMFHLLGALPEHGKLGMVCIGATPERAEELYRQTVAVLDKETAG
jgi:hypothetical protein